MNDFKKIACQLGNRLDDIIEYLIPRDMAQLSLTCKDNLNHMKTYFERIREMWEEIPHIKYNTRRYIFKPIKVDILKKCMMVLSCSYGQEPEMILIEILNIYMEKDTIKVYGLVLGGSHVMKMQDGRISKEKRDKAQKVFRQYPIYFQNSHNHLQAFHPHHILYIHHILNYHMEHRHNLHRCYYHHHKYHNHQQLMYRPNHPHNPAHSH